jgi:hypothetical protein
MYFNNYVTTKYGQKYNMKDVMRRCSENKDKIEKREEKKRDVEKKSYYSHAGYDIAHDDMVKYSLYPAMHKRNDNYYQKELSEQDIADGMVFHMDL